MRRNKTDKRIRLYLALLLTAACTAYVLSPWTLMPTPHAGHADRVLSTCAALFQLMQLACGKRHPQLDRMACLGKGIALSMLAVVVAVMWLTECFLAR